MLNRHWSFWIFVLLGILFVLWFFFGGQEQEFVGLGPLINVISTDALQVEEVCPYEDTITSESDLVRETKPPLIIHGDQDIPDVPFPDRPSKWKRQERCCRAAEEIFGLPFRRDVRDLPWLYNPETGSNLELDCYNDEIKIAIEHNGQHHYKFPNHWNKNREEWIAQIRRDRLKPDLCDQNGVYLVTIPYSVPFNSIKDEIRRHIQPLL